jgi:site-specific DNA-methyltransferase (adenine-specific)
LQLADALELVPELEKCKTEDEAWKAMKKIQESLALHELLKRVKGGEMEALLGELTEKVEEGEATPFEEREHRKTQAWRYASNNYIVGDALEAMREMAGGIMHFAEVDPPYGIDLEKSKKAVVPDGEMDTYQEIASSEYRLFCHDVAKEVFRILSHNSFCIWWFAFEYYSDLKEVLEIVGFKVNPVPGIWIKGSGQAQQPQVHLASSYEPFLVCRKGTPALNKAGRINVFDYKPVLPRDKIHPTERPIALMQEILRTFAYPSSFVLVPFLGSGVTLRAVYREHMAGVGWDLSEEYKAKFLLKVEEDLREGKVGE